MSPRGFRLPLLALFLGVLTLSAGPMPEPNHKPGLTDLYGDPLPVDAPARMGTIRFHTEGSVKCVAFSPDGKSLVVGSGGFKSNMQLQLCDASTGKVIRRFADSKLQHDAALF